MLRALFDMRVSRTLSTFRPVMVVVAPINSTTASRRSPANRQRNQRPGCAVEAVEPAAGINKLGKLRIADSGALTDGPDAARLFLEVPDEFAAGAFLRDPAAVLGENRDARAKQGAPHHWDQRHPVHQLQHLGRIALARPGRRPAQERVAPHRRAPGCEILGAADPRPSVAAWGRK